MHFCEVLVSDQWCCVRCESQEVYFINSLWSAYICVALMQRTTLMRDDDDDDVMDVSFMQKLECL